MQRFQTFDRAYINQHPNIAHQVVLLVVSFFSNTAQQPTFA